MGEMRFLLRENCCFRLIQIVCFILLKFLSIEEESLFISCSVCYIIEFQKVYRILEPSHGSSTILIPSDILVTLKRISNDSILSLFLKIETYVLQELF